MMTPTIDNLLGQHEARLDGHDTELAGIHKEQADDRNDVRALKNWIMGAVATAMVGLLMQLIAIATRK